MKIKSYEKHALLQAKITALRSKDTPPPIFARILHEISLILCADISASLALQSCKVETPLQTTQGFKLRHRLVLIPILRAGLGMLSGFHALLPEAAVGHIGVERDHDTLQPRFYYYKVPPLAGSEIWLLDPMLATGGSLEFALQKILPQKPERVRAVSVIAAPEGIRRIRKKFPQVFLHVGVIDKKLNDHGYILPGLGDAGDRCFGT
ncbi:MAG: uracil phosphoribosyltransferase [Turneriella sp.]|nr:uracil phosphoribosyltransferase [Leptospiraceae bacterium]MCX7633283.1 uracil phosphoribosyltransferase [Turneriella sp.]